MVLYVTSSIYYKQKGKTKQSLKVVYGRHLTRNIMYIFSKWFIGN